MNVLNYQYKLGNSFIFLTDSIKDLDVHFDCKLQFHRHIDFLFTSVLKQLGLIRIIMVYFSNLDNLPLLYFALVRFKSNVLLLLGALLWLRTDSNTLERLCHSTLFQDVECHNDNLLRRLNLLTLHNRCRHFDTLFLINILLTLNIAPPILERVGLQIPTRNIRNFTMDTCSSSHYLSANAVFIHTDVLTPHIWVLKS
jgi:hypothetical protein